MVISVASYKGGVGKTTTAIHLAAYFQTLEPTLLLDGDLNRSALRWAEPGKLPFQVVDHRQAAMHIHRYRHVVVDTQARPDTPEERSLLKGMVRNAHLTSGSIRIDLEPGDVCVFDTWGIHRARYRRDRIRRTLDLLFGFGPRKRVEYGALLALATRR